MTVNNTDTKTNTSKTNDNSGAKKNILVIMVDQLSFPSSCYGDDGGLLPELKEIIGFQGETAGKNAYSQFFPGFWGLRKNAVVLRNHTIAASACTPSRSAIMTGQYGARTGVTQTDGLFKNADAPSFPWLAADGVPTVGDWFRGVGYRSHYFGKWHVSNPPGHTLQDYGFDDWELSWPEPHGASINNLGAYRDHGFADLACAFLRNEGLGMAYNRAQAQQAESAPLANAPSTTPSPWFAVVSFANPHDIAVYPALVRGLDPDAPKLGPLPVPAQGAMSAPPIAGTFSFPLNPLGFLQENANLPPSVDEPLTNKPSCQFDYAYKMGLALASKTAYGIEQAINQASSVNPTNAADLTLKAAIPFQLTHNPNAAALKFIQYYAWLIQMVDGHIARVLSALDESGQRENTIVVYMSDHGEYAGAHNYMLEKWHSAYQEAIHVPVVVQSAAINSDTEMRQVDALTSHVDILPTLLGLAGVSEQELAEVRVKLQADHSVPPFTGVNLTQVIMGADMVATESDGTPRVGVLFVTDDEITQPLEGDEAYQIANDQAFEVFVQAVEVLRTENVKGLHPQQVAGLAPGPVRQPNHVRCVRTLEWKLSRYWDPSHKEPDEWELYNLTTDGCELTNLLVTNAQFPTPIANLPTPYDKDGIIATAEELRKLLEKLELSHLSTL